MAAISRTRTPSRALCAVVAASLAAAAALGVGWDARADFAPTAGASLGGFTGARYTAWRFETGQIDAETEAAGAETPVGALAAFAQALRGAHLSLANAAAARDDFDAANHFVDRAELIASGVLPAVAAAPSSDAAALAARATLLRLISSGARREAPGPMADAEAAYDCWVSTAPSEAREACQAQAVTRLTTLAERLLEASETRREAEGGFEIVIRPPTPVERSGENGEERIDVGGGSTGGAGGSETRVEATPPPAPTTPEPTTPEPTPPEPTTPEPTTSEPITTEPRAPGATEPQATTQQPPADDLGAVAPPPRRERPRTPPAQSETPPPPRPSGVASEHIVYFAFDSAEITAEAAATLRQAARAAATVGGRLEIVVAGHADRAGSRRYNLGLSRRRAEAVAAALNGALPPGAQIRREAFGEDDPALPTADGVREALNRRVEVAVAVR